MTHKKRLLAELKQLEKSENKSAFMGAAIALQTLSAHADAIRLQLKLKDYTTKAEKKRLQADFRAILDEMQSINRLMRRLH